MPAGISAVGTQVEIGAAGDEDEENTVGDATFSEDLGCVVKADLPELETQFVEDKCLGLDPAVVPSIPTWLMPGEMSLGLKYGQDAYVQIKAWQLAKKRLWVRLTFPKQLTSAGILQATATTAVFRAYIRQPKIDFPEDGGRVPLDVSLKIDSDITVTPGTAI